MCGFYLRCSLEKDLQSTKSDLNLLRNTSHRGPDESCLTSISGAVVGFNRLAIRSVADGSQPYENEARNFVSCFNGELYNMEVIVKKLSTIGDTTRIPSGDMQVLAEYIADFGLDCIGDLEGMFAGFVLFTQSNELLLVRDRVGEKPIFFSIQDDLL